MGTKPQRKAASERKIPPRVKEGRPTSFKPEFVEQARNLCTMGATDYEIAQFFKVHVGTLWRWRSQIPEFCEAVQIGKKQSDERVKMSLYHRAVGYNFDAEELFSYQGEVFRTNTVKHVPPDVGAAMNWLKNRCPDEWRERTEQITVNVTLADLVNLSFKADLPDLPELPAPKVIENEE